MQIIKLSEATAARRRVPIRLVDDTDGKTAETGVTVSGSECQVMENGGSWTNATGSLVEVSAGDYYYEFATGEIDTFGPIRVKVDKTGIRRFDAVAQIVAFDPYDAAGLGLSRLDAAVTTRATPADILSGDRQTLRAGTLQGGSTTTAQLDAGASASNSAYANAIAVVTHASGLQEWRSAASYNGTTKTITFAGAAMAEACASGDAFFLLLGVEAIVGNTVDANFVEVGGVSLPRQQFARGLAQVLSGVVAAGFTPTTNVFNVSGFPVLGNVNNLNGRDIYFRTGDIAHHKNRILSLSDQGSGIYQITTASVMPEAPAVDDELEVL